MAKKEFTEVEAELYSIIYEYIVNNRLTIESAEAITRGVIKDLKARAVVG